MSMKWLTENSRRRKRAVRLTVAFAFMVSLVISSPGCSLLPDEKKEEELPVITPPKLAEKPTYTVTTQTIETKVRGNGKIMSMQEKQLFFVMGGRKVKSVHVQPGDRVTAGTVIAELDVSDLQNQLRTKRLQFQNQEREMINTLRNKDSMSEEEFEQARTAFELERASILELEEQIASATLKAPIDGTLVSLNIKPGDTSEEYMPIGVIADTSDLIVAVQLSADNLQKVAVGMEADVEINAFGSHKGKIVRLPSQEPEPQDPWNPVPRQEDSIHYYVLIELDEFPEGVERGAPLSASIVVDRRENAIVIPPSALRTYGGRTYVQIVEADGTKREVDVEVGQQTSTVVEIIKGLEPGMKVVGR